MLVWLTFFLSLLPLVKTIAKSDIRVNQTSTMTVLDSEIDEGPRFMILDLFSRPYCFVKEGESTVALIGYL